MKSNRILEEISKHIKETQDLIDNHPGLLSGYSGTIVFLIEYYKITRDLSLIEIIESLVNRLLHITISGQITSCNHADGLTGINWLLQYLKNEDFIGNEADSLIEHINSIIGNWMINEIHAKNYDFLYGALGPLNCLVSQRKQSLKIQYALEGIETIAKESPIGYRWTNPNDPDNCDLGLAHGMGSIIKVLLKTHQNSVYKVRTKKLILQACDYILSIRNDFNEVGFYWPHSTISNTKSRLAWCYGDLSLGYVLFKTGVTLGIKELEKISLQVLLNTSNRIDPKSNLVNDCCLCHGSLGLALIYNRLTLLTKENQFTQASLFWLNYSISKIGLSNEPIIERINTDLSSFGGEGNHDYNIVMKSTILSGVSGIGLSIISIDSRTPQNWLDSIML
jgi:lantibiotic modifying enzyme